MQSAKSILKSIIPPILLKPFKRKNDWGWFGPYDTWQAAEKNAIGYDAEHILSKMQNAFRSLNKGEKVFELDTILYDEKKYNTPLLFALNHIASQTKEQLNIIDFGGSLGSSFYWSRDYIPPQFKLNWSIIEQKHIVKAGREEFETEQLHFYNTFEEAVQNKRPDVLLLSSVMQYIEHPEFIFEAIEQYKFPYIIIDRTPYFENPEAKSAITIQLLNAHVYGKPTTLTCRIFSQNDLIKQLENNYELLIDKVNFENLKYDFYGEQMYFRFLFFKLKES